MIEQNVVERVELFTKLTMVLILVWFTLRYRNILVFAVIILGYFTIITPDTHEPAWVNVIGQINAGLVTYILYDYMKAKFERANLLRTNQAASIADAADYAIVGVDLTGIIVSWNNVAESVFGWTAQEAIGQSISIIMPEEMLPEQKQIFQTIGKGEIVDDLISTRKRRDGSNIKLEMTIAPVRHAANDQIIGASAIMKEVKDDSQS